jgi:long-chain acyl-CoA synthetase
MVMKSPFLDDWLFAHSDSRPEAPAISTPTLRLSYGDLATRVLALAGALAAEGVQPGDRVLIALPSLPAAVVAGLSVHRLGGTAVEVNREWSPEVLAGIVARSGVRQAVVWGRDARTWGPLAAGAGLERLWVVHDAELPARLKADLGVTPGTLLLADGRLDPTLGSASPAARGRHSDGQPALILYTSGSTGIPRGVVQTFRNLDANSRSIVAYLGLDATDRALLVLPLYYCYGRSVLQTHLLAGGSVHLDNRFAYPRMVLEALGAEGCTGFAGVPLTYEIIRRQVDVSTLTFPRLRYLTQAGGPMAPETIDWVRAAFAPARLFVMYGQTEATARLSYLPPERAIEKRGSIGIAIPGVELAVLDDKGRALPPGEVGHLVARGDNVTPGYLDEPAETAAILHDGWLWTGDLAERDADGFFFHRGRSKDILKVGGHRVSPIEIEHVVAEHPDIAEVAVIGRPDALLGEVPVAFVVPRPGHQPVEDGLKVYCRARMAPYRVPARFITVASLPRNEAGKLLRAKLLEQAGVLTAAGSSPPPAP